MARLPRLVIPQQVHHITQAGIDGKIIFVDNADYIAFTDWLRSAAKQFGIQIHAYVILPDRLHLLATPSDEVGLGKMMQWLGRYYVPYFNAKYKRSGLLWQGRFKATVLEAENYFLPCSVMIEEMPVRAGLVHEASAYLWSSCQHHLGARIDPIVADHAMYWGMGNTPFQREAAYRQLLDKGLSANEMTTIQQATNKAWVLGSDSYKNQMAKLTERRVEPMRRGRPRKALRPE
ncbi:transposase [Undibacterium fentianense]|uniref:Transposase n=1 Tax=Undibacterium fentianense TaxID=2828728 RepID=A0A941E412_9BURK|nr:transposase [Undibacterium fentianense]MBR7800782.1 transposase [Undibacterium fentianense]